MWVETESQKGILIGPHGRMIKAIGTAARKEIERELAEHVHLDLSVRVRRSWRADDALLDRLGITRGRLKDPDTPVAAHPRRLAPPALLTCHRHASRARAARGTGGCTTSAGPIILQRTLSGGRAGPPGPLLARVAV